jgi:hypothetical protein
VRRGKRPLSRLGRDSRRTCFSFFSLFRLFFSALPPSRRGNARARIPKPARDPLRSSSGIPRSKWSSRAERRDSRGSDYLFSSQYLLTLSAAPLDGGQKLCRWERYIKKRADARAHCRSHCQIASARVLINARFGTRAADNPRELAYSD